MNRRNFLTGTLITLAVTAALGTNTAVAKMGRGGLVGVSQGVFPNADPALLPMRQVYPAPAGVQSWESHQIAYFKPSNGDTFQWRKRIGVSFGRWPYVYRLRQGPPGMQFGATTWSTAWDGKGNAAYQAGYGVLQWTPTAAISPSSPALVSVDIIDQDNNILNIQWNIFTSDDVASGGVFGFLNADSGSDTTGNGSKATPWQTIAHAVGSTVGSGGAAPAKSILVPMGAAAMYTWPSTGTATIFQMNANQPGAYVGYPGQSATIDLSGMNPTQGNLVTVPVDGTFFQDISLSGYYTGAGQNGNFRAFAFAQTNRLTFQGIIWNDSGCGSTSGNNASMFWASGGTPTFGQYLFITGCQDNNRQSLGTSNNTAVCELYNYIDSLIEMNLANSPLSHIGDSYFPKSDMSYCCMRANLGIFAGSTWAFEWGQAPYGAMHNNEATYNVIVGTDNIEIPAVGGFAWGTIRDARNNFLSTNGIEVAPAAQSSNMQCPYTSANNSQVFGINVPAPSVNPNGGILGPGTWFYGVTAVGVTGETKAFATGSGSNELSVTTTGNSNSVTFGIFQGQYVFPSALHVWRGNTAGGETQYTTIPANATSFTDDGTLTWTTATLPTTDTAVTASRFIINNNIAQGSAATNTPSGATVSASGNQLVHSGVLNTTTGLLLVSNGGTIGAQLS